MKCPKCEKKSVCFCDNCKSRRNMPRQRSERIIKVNYLKCPYCKDSFDIDYLEQLAYDEYDVSKNNQNN